jgi:hypothetical protein
MDRPANGPALLFGGKHHGINQYQTNRHSGLNRWLCRRRTDVEQIKKSVPSMAHWGGSGNGQCCKDCAHFGFHETVRNNSGDAVQSRHRRNCCRKFHQLTGKIGAAIPPGTESCKYFEAR